MDKGMITGILKDEQRGMDLAKQGYSIFPFLDSAEIEALSNYYFEIQKEAPNHFYSSTHSPDYTFRRKTSDFIKNIVAHKVGEVCKDYQLLGGAFVVKPPHGKGILPPHQDWNIVDEQVTRSYNIWIPLVNVTIENGAVFVLPASHSKMQSFRGPGIPSPFNGIEAQVWESLQPLPMQAGEALFYDHALLHASPVNQTAQIRLGIVCGVIPMGVGMQLYFNEGGTINCYKATEDFFLEKDPLNGPQGLIRIEGQYTHMQSLSADEYQRLFLGEEKLKKKKWYEKIFG